MKKTPTDRHGQKHRQELSPSLTRLLDPVSAVDSMIAKALEMSACKIGLVDSAACLERLKKSEPAAVNYYCYHFAKEMGEVLGSWSKNIKSVFSYCYDEQIDGEDSCEQLTSFPLIHMIILVERKSKALDALIDAVDSALVQRHRQMLDHKQLEHALDARVIDDEDIKNRTGYAMLLRSVYRPPIKLWEKGL